MSEVEKKPGQQSWVGLVIIIVGGLLLLQSLGIGNFGHFLAQWWPLIIVGVGFAKMRSNDRRGGMIILVVGLVLLSATLHFINWGVIFRFWPVVIILVGLSIYLQSTGKPGLSLMNRNESTDDFVHLNAFFGGVNRVVTSKDFQGGNILCLFGGVELDLRQAEIGEAAADLNVTTLFGGTEVIIPTNWKVDVHGTPLFGGIEDKSNGGGEDASHLTLRATAAFGGIEIHN